VGIAGSVRIGRSRRIGGAAMIVAPSEIPDGNDHFGGTFVQSTKVSRGHYTECFRSSST
jgi:UDP-3-O-[3-hydroxymyristoyl] glucosamine N-acyltransferase